MLLLLILHEWIRVRYSSGSSLTASVVSLPTVQDSSDQIAEQHCLQSERRVDTRILDVDVRADQCTVAAVEPAAGKASVAVQVSEVQVSVERQPSAVELAVLRTAAV